MLLQPFRGVPYTQHFGGGSGGTIITSHATAHSKGAWTQFSSSTPFPIGCLELCFAYVHTVADEEGLLDISFGADNMVLEGLPVHVPTAANLPGDICPMTIPLFVPTGTDLRLRWQSSGSSESLHVSIIAHPHIPGLPCYQHGKCYGINTGTSLGKTYDPGGTADTKGGPTEIVAATDFRAKALWAIIGTNAVNSTTTGAWVMDICYGAATETIMVPDIPFGTYSAIDRIIPSFHGPYYLDIPKGTRLSVDAECTHTDATDRKFDVALLAMG